MRCCLTNSVSTLRSLIGYRWRIVDLVYSRLPYLSRFSHCPLCSAKLPATGLKSFNTQCIFNGGAIERYQCPYCDVIFGPKKMFALSNFCLDIEYKLHYSVYAEGDSTEFELRAFHALNPKRNRIYLNYGSGTWSNTSETLREDGWKVYDFDPCVTRKSGQGKWELSRGMLREAKFHGIFSNNVLEHMRHPIRELRAMAALLKPNGRMAHATPCYQYLYEYTRFHLFFYLGNSSSMLFSRARLHQIGEISDGDFICKVLQKNRKNRLSPRSLLC